MAEGVIGDDFDNSPVDAQNQKLYYRYSYDLVEAINKNKLVEVWHSNGMVHTYDIPIKANGTDMNNDPWEPGVYMLVIERDGYLDYIINNLLVEETYANTASPTLEAQYDFGFTRLYPGDIDGDGDIDLKDTDLFVNASQTFQGIYQTMAIYRLLDRMRYILTPGTSLVNYYGNPASSSLVVSNIQNYYFDENKNGNMDTDEDPVTAIAGYYLSEQGGLRDLSGRS